MSMASYIELIRRDVCYHKSCDASSWPSSVSEFVRSLQNEMKIPGWLKSGPVPYTNERVIDLFDQLRGSNDTSNVDLWDSCEKIIDKETEQRLRVVFNTALADCATIRAVIEAENLTNIPYPKESFLVILVRNAILDAHARLSSLEDVPVVFPRHFSGEVVPILNYMTKSIRAPLIISIGQAMPAEENGPNLEHQSSDEDDDPSVHSEPFKHPPPTLSEFLNACDRTKTPEEAEEEPGGDFPPSQFEAYFRACSSSELPPSICHIPVLCMADEEQLPVLMSSLLYQRRLWHVIDPLVGLAFSKYDTAVRLVVGWVEDNLPIDRTLPRVHLGEIGTPIELDLSSPSAALVLSRFLCSLESHLLAVYDSVRQSVTRVICDTRSHSSLAWRIDTDIRNEDSVSLQERRNTRDTIIQWVKSQKYAICKETMPPRNLAEISLAGSATSIPSLQSTSTHPPYPPSTWSAASPQDKSSAIPEIREPHTCLDDVPTLMSRLSCSVFAATSKKSDPRVFRWMFDRRVVPQSVPSDLEFREEYSIMTGFIWPDAWRNREDLPPVDAALEPCVSELLEGVAALKSQSNAVKCIPVAEFPVDLRVLEQSFSAIFQASRRAREKKELRENLYEACWRHDHDRLLFDFFIRLIQERRGGALETLTGSKSITHLEDPLARPTLEAVLRFPMSEYLQSGIDEESQESMRRLIIRETADLRDWVLRRGGSSKVAIEERRNVSYVLSQWSAWTLETDTEPESQTISKLGQLPSTGKCDALGRLLVEVPNVPSEVLSHFPLVVHAGTELDKEATVNKTPKMQSGAHAESRGRSEKFGGESTSSLIIPHHTGVTRTETRCTMLSSSIPSPMQSSNVSSMDSLIRKTQMLQMGPDAMQLELPVLTVEYKKASDNMMKGTNQLRMYLTASVKFLQAIGITNVPVYGVQTDGPIVVLPAAVLRDDDFTYLFERLVEKLDISTPLGAWHYATILCRLAQNHAEILEKKFEEVKDKVSSSAGDGQAGEWTIDHQIAKLKAGKRVKSPLQEKSNK